MDRTTGIIYVGNLKTIKNVYTKKLPKLTINRPVWKGTGFVFAGREKVLPPSVSRCRRIIGTDLNIVADWKLLFCSVCMTGESSCSLENLIELK